MLLPLNTVPHTYSILIVLDRVRIVLFDQGINHFSLSLMLGEDETWHLPAGGEEEDHSS